MDTTARRRRIHKNLAHPDQVFYNHDVNMYTESPQNTITLAEFEELSLERLQLLRIIEQASLKGHKQFSDEWKQTIKDDLLKNGLKKYTRLLGGYNGQTEADIQVRRADHLSHYILRLAYCRSEDLRRWFISREMEWFKLKFLAQNTQGVLKFLEINDMHYKPISNEEKEDVRCELIVCTRGITEVSLDSTDFYKLPFAEVVPLVKNRRVFLHLGYAYIPMSDLVVCVQSQFRAKLSEALNLYNHRLPSLDDDRLNTLLGNLHSSYTGKDYAVQTDKEKINPPVWTRTPNSTTRCACALRTRFCGLRIS
ncbi:hypothetical protein NQ317_017166 [Molorchus minor]|uniref:DNA primase large subunit n=1 Tax=Molorchus minor TaxID=1323400 RepID=A0ABQ9J1Q6_9CUCU|nr:hypothetical protein NQ317_017166 [Molorchus minor]